MPASEPRTPSATAALVSRIAPRAVALVFALSFLLSLGCGTSLLTALIRGSVCACGALLLAPLLAWPVARALVEAAVREEQQRAPGPGGDA